MLFLPYGKPKGNTAPHDPMMPERKTHLLKESLQVVVLGLPTYKKNDPPSHARFWGPAKDPGDFLDRSPNLRFSTFSTLLPSFPPFSEAGSWGLPQTLVMASKEFALTRVNTLETCTLGEEVAEALRPGQRTRTQKHTRLPCIPHARLCAAEAGAFFLLRPGVLLIFCLLVRGNLGKSLPAQNGSQGPLAQRVLLKSTSGGVDQGWCSSSGPGMRVGLLLLCIPLTPPGCFTVPGCSNI